MVQIDGPRRQVFIKFIDVQYVHDILQITQHTAEYKHSNGVVSVLRIEMAGLGTKPVRIGNLPPEIQEGILRAHIAPYGEIHTIQEAHWSNFYRYKVANGIRIGVIALTKHIPSYFTIVGHRVLVSYNGQPQTCFGCGDMEHLLQVCPKRRTRGGSTGHLTQPTWAGITANSPMSQSLTHTDIRENINPSGDQMDLTADRPPSDDRFHTTSNNRPAPIPTAQTHAPARQVPEPFDAASEGMEQDPMPGREEEEGSTIEREDYRIVSDSPYEGRLLEPEPQRSRTSTKNSRASTTHGRVRVKVSVCAPRQTPAAAGGDDRDGGHSN
jgi:hypothetical protein